MRQQCKPRHNGVTENHIVHKVAEEAGKKSINYTVLYTASGQRLGSKEKTQLAGLERAVQ